MNRWGRFARGRFRTPGADRINRTEARYAERLRLKELAGEILWWRPKSIKLRLADATFITIDFAVMAQDGTLELHEVKGGIAEDDAWAKIKIAAEQFPFRFAIARERRGAWDVRYLDEVGAHGMQMATKSRPPTSAPSAG